MDPNLRKAVQDYKEKQKNSGPAVDCVELERCFREFKTELYIKRVSKELIILHGHMNSLIESSIRVILQDEVHQLRTELDAANLEIQNLKKALDVTKKALDENQFNLKFQLKKASNNEELLKKRESLMKVQIQHKMAVKQSKLF